MAAMTTALAFFSRLGDKVTYMLPLHTVQKPQVAVCTRKVPVGKQTTQTYECNVSVATVDGDGTPLPDKFSFKTIVSQPIAGQVTDRDAALAIHRDIVASDEFATAISTGKHIGD